VETPEGDLWLNTISGIFHIRKAEIFEALLDRKQRRNRAASHVVNVAQGEAFRALVLLGALFLRGVGLSAVGIPSISAAYASVRSCDGLPTSSRSSVVP
jgi:hypothetical protein